MAEIWSLLHGANNNSKYKLIYFLEQTVSRNIGANDVAVLVQSLCHVRFCDAKDCSTPGSSVLHYLLEFAQIHVRLVGDAIQPSHPLLSPSPPAFILSQHQGLF